MTSNNAGDTRTTTVSPLSPAAHSARHQDQEEPPTMTTPNSSPRLLLTVDEAAAALGMGRTAIFEQLRLGRLKSVKVGRARRIPLDYIEDFITLLKTEAAADDAA